MIPSFSISYNVICCNYLRSDLLNAQNFESDLHLTSHQLRDPDFLAGNGFVACALKNMFQARVSTFAYQLLASFLLRIGERV